MLVVPLTSFHQLAAVTVGNYCSGVVKLDVFHLFSLCVVFFCQMITSDIASLQRNHSNMLAKIDEYKRRQLELSHRVLQVRS